MFPFLRTQEENQRSTFSLSELGGACSALNSYILSNLAGHYNFKLHAIFYGWCILKIFHAWISTKLKTISWFSFFRETKHDTKNTQQTSFCLFQSYNFFCFFLNIRKFFVYKRTQVLSVQLIFYPINYDCWSQCSFHHRFHMVFPRKLEVTF